MKSIPSKDRDRKTPHKPLTPKMKRFAEEYLVDLVAAHAAIRAGYSRKSARWQGSQLLANPKVQAYIQKKANKFLDSKELTSERVLAEIAKLAFANMDDFTRRTGDYIEADFSDLTRDQMAAVQEFTLVELEEGEKQFKFKLADKKASLELLGRYFKLFTDKVEHSGAIDLSGASDEELEDIIKNG